MAGPLTAAWWARWGTRAQPLGPHHPPPLIRGPRHLLSPAHPATPNACSAYCTALGTKRHDQTPCRLYLNTVFDEHAHLVTSLPARTEALVCMARPFGIAACISKNKRHAILIKQCSSLPESPSGWQWHACHDCRSGNAAPCVACWVPHSCHQRRSSLGCGSPGSWTAAHAPPCHAPLCWAAAVWSPPAPSTWVLKCKRQSPVGF